MKKPKILIVFTRRGSETSTRFGGFVTRIQKNGGFAYADVAYVALEDLLFHIVDEKTAEVYDPLTNIHLKDFDFVYFKSWYGLSALATSAALYLEGMGIPYADRQVGHGYVNKVSNQMARWNNQVAVPATVWGTLPVLLAYVAREDTIYPLIIKAVNGQKGQDNFLVRTADEAVEILSSTDKDMMIQEFIPNDGDYRIGVYGHKARWAIYRKSGGESHLNNTSAGGVAVHMPIETVDEDVRLLAERAAAATDLAISGVDVVRHCDTGKLYIFEANQGSQIVTGAYSDTNMTAFDEGMRDMVARRRKNVEPAAKMMIGRRVYATIEGGDTPVRFVAKVDTGAYQSAIDATDIELHVDDQGQQYLQYTLRPRGNEATAQRFRTYDFGTVGVLSSMGTTETRYVVPMTIRIHGMRYTTRVTLANRTSQKCQMLIGRTLLVGNFIVNVDYSDETREAK